MLRRSLISLGFGVLLVGSGPGTAQAAGKKPLSIAAIYGGELSGPSPSQIQWTPDGKLSFFLRGADEGRDLWLFDPARGERSVLVKADVLARLAPAPGQAGLTERERTRRTRYHVPACHWSPDGHLLLLTSAGEVQLYDVKSGEGRRLAASKSGVLDPRFSPDGKWVSFVYQHDIWIVPTAGGEERQLTIGGSDLVLHGDLDWVYPEELGIRRGYEWSPDSARIAFLELDERKVPTYPITDLLTNQASVDLQRYPKPGDPNPAARVGIVEVATGHTVWMGKKAEYIPRIQWVSPLIAAVQLLNRGQDHLEIALVDAATGESRTVLTETDDHWVDVTDDLHFLAGGTELVWTSQRDGFRHVYLYRVGDTGAELVRRLTAGDWQVAEVDGVDQKAGYVYFSANKDDAIGNDLYRVKLDGTGLERLTEGSGTHRIDMSPSADAYVDTFSSLTDPGRITYRRVGAKESFLLDEKRHLDDVELVTPERKMLDTPDGAKVSVLLLKPAQVAAGERRPLVCYVYGMPGFPTIRDAWGGNRYLFHQYLVQQGFVVAQIDDRSSAIWGHKYAVLADHDIGPLEIKDHAVALEYLKSLPFVDPNRTAVWGWSGGGFSTAFHMTHSGLFQVGVAGAPVTDWHLYDSIYTERYMGLPADDPAAYARTSSVVSAAKETGHLLLIFGTQDDNVHPQNTIQLADRLIKARKQFDLMLYPNKTHGIRGQNENIQLWTMIAGYFERYLKP